MAGKRWSQDELLTAFRLYCQIPFGQFHTKNKDVLELALKLRRTPASIAMKLCNFASFDPQHQNRGVTGLANAGKADREIYEAFRGDWDHLVEESRLAAIRLGIEESEPPATTDVDILAGTTETIRLLKVRRVQAFFRRSVLASYESRCGICRIAIPELIQASHIIPWSQSEGRRADPTNGIALCTFHDRLFDRGLITLDDNYRVTISSRIVQGNVPVLHQVGILDVAGANLALPHRFAPDREALNYHREQIFQSN